MVRIRKNANALTTAERNRFLRALATLNGSASGRFRDFRDMHVAGAPDREAHGGAGFLPWHRIYLLDLERELQRIDSDVALPYWRFDEAAPNLFTRRFMGVPGPQDRVQFTSTNPLRGWVAGNLPGVERGPGVGPQTLPLVRTEQQTLALGGAPAADFTGFAVMQGNPHGRAHMSHISGVITDPGTAPQDPLFFLLHCNVDRLWAKWQWAFRRHDPAAARSFATGSTRAGHRIGDRLWPWSGPLAAPRPTTAPGGGAHGIAHDGCPGRESARARHDRLPRHELIRSSRVRVRRRPVPDGRCDAMTDETDIEELRKAYVAELAEVRRARPRPLTARRAAEALTPELTEAKLEAMLLDADTFDTAVRLLLDLLADETAAVEHRLTALERLGGAAFQPMRFAPFRAEFVERLRELAVSHDKQLRYLALDRLTLDDDEVGKRLLRESLEGTRAQLVPPATATRFLARDEHGDAAPLFRELARTGSARVREEALRALAADPESVELLATISTDKAERPKVRELAAMSLKANSPERFAHVAHDLVLDEEEDDKLRSAALSALAFTSEAADALDNEAFQADLDHMKDGTTSRTLLTSIDRFAKTRGQKPPE
ncbi:tyrosinase family protein [Agromyces sp. SYSU K20354]|uniref:tyrosinase family protein n=1 Tax=Agromyces cavernae TaxID=2898659 RepID=UPI001E4C4797|nr:tyrosinase family protein [Agromyces cavernae]MCD2443370.1 tyrosinase family protein [Agromyces cavernae]